MHNQIDRLEPRRHLDGAYARLDRDGILRVFGTAGDDHLELTLVPRTASGDTSAAASLGVTIAVTEDGNAIPTTFAVADRVVRTVRLYLRDGNDTVVFTNAAGGRTTRGKSVFVDAGAGNDSIATGPGEDTIVAGDGNDTVFGDRARDQIDGGSGADDLRGGVGDDTISAGGGNDRIRGGGGDDLVNAGRGNDRIYSADTGNSTLRGEAGNDTLFNGSGQDACSGGAGEDLVDYSARREAVFIDLSAADTVGEQRPVEGGTNVARKRNGNLFDDGRFTIDEKVGNHLYNFDAPAPEPAASEPIKPYLVPQSVGYAGVGSKESDTLAEVEHAIGGSGDDVILGSSLRNNLRGSAGNDWIFAGSREDDVYGDAGDDHLFVADTRDGMPMIVDDEGRGVGTDVVNGGEGNDFARIDARDYQQFRSNLETVEALRALWS